MRMLIDAVDAVDKWKQRYERTHAAFQEKHVYVTRLEMRVDALEKQIKKAASIEKRMTLLEKELERAKKVKKVNTKRVSSDAA